MYLRNEIPFVRVLSRFLDTALARHPTPAAGWCRSMKAATISHGVFDRRVTSGAACTIEELQPPLPCRL